MADMFYFRSPTRPPSPKDRVDFRRKLKVYKRRRCAKMDNFMERTCVARLDEPLFVPSRLASLIPHYDFRESIQEKASASEEARNTVQERYDDGTTKLVKDDVSPNTSSTPEPLSSRELRDSSSHTLHNLRHSRPESHDLAQEEDGRRTRFALEDPGESAMLMQRLLHLTTPTERSSMRHGHNSNESRTWLPTSIDPLSLLPPLNRNLFPYSSYDDVDDALAVDDPARSYDFKDFLRRWHIDEQEQPSEEPLPEISTLISPSIDHVSQRDLASGDADIQGLRWNDFGLHRKQALESRQLHHPLSRTLIPLHKATPASTKDMIDQPHTSDTQYRFRAFSRWHRAHYSHYQLRNVLAAVNRNEVFYATDNRVVKTALGCQQLETTAIDLTKTSPSHSALRVTCLSATLDPYSASYRSDRVLLAGGFNGEYAMVDLTAEHNPGFHSGFVTHDYNGLVTHVDSYAHRRSGALKACFCSNDRKVRIMDVKTQRFLNSFTYDAAVNCSALSPDGRLRVLVGDSQETLITDAEKGDILVTMKEHQDHGFASAWSEDGRHVATGAQDSMVVLWDSRNWSLPLRTMHCGMATARSLHFTSDGALVVGEDDDMVTIHDINRPNMKQEIRFFGSIAGIALLDGGDELLIANADKTVGGLLSFSRSLQGLSTQSSKYSRALFHDFECRESKDGYGVIV